MMLLATTNWGNAALMALVSIMLVFTVLVLLIFILKLFGVIFHKKAKAAAASVGTSSDEITDEEVAAIAVAVNLFFNRHDEESDVLTFRQNHDVSAWQVRNINKQL